MTGFQLTLSRSLCHFSVKVSGMAMQTFFESFLHLTVGDIIFLDLLVLLNVELK